MNTNLQKKQTKPLAHLQIVHRSNQTQRKECFNPDGIQFVNDFSNRHIQGLKTITEHINCFFENPTTENRDFIIRVIANWEYIIGHYIDFKQYRTEFNKLEKFRHE